MAVTIKMSDSAQRFYDRGLERADEGRLAEALDDFYAALRREPGSFWMLSEIAYAYLHMGQLHYAIKTYMKLLSFEKKLDIGYLGLIQCYIGAGKPNLALYYLGLGLENGALSPDYKPEIDEIKEDTVPDLQVLKGNGATSVVTAACKLMAGGESEFARQMFETVPKGDGQYIAARAGLAMLELQENNFARSAEICEEILRENANDQVALTCALIAYTDMGGHEERVAELKRAIDGLRLSEESDLRRVAVAFMSSGDDEACARYFGKLVAISPYDRDYNLAYALAQYNLHEYAIARKHMLTIRRAYPEDRVVGYYSRFFYGDRPDRIPVAFDLPAGEKLRRLHRIEETLSELADVDRVAKRLRQDEELRDMVMWLLYSDELVMAERVGAFLGQHADWQPVIREMLVDPDVAMSVKKACLLSLLRYADKKKFVLTVGEALAFYNGRIPRCPDTYDMRDAYYLAFTTLAIMGIDCRNKLSAHYKKYVAIMSERDFKPFKIKPNAMAALLAYSTRANKVFRSADSTCALFDCEKKDFMRYADALNVAITEETNDDTEEEQ